MNIFFTFISHKKEILFGLIAILIIMLTACICFDTIMYREIKPDGSVKEFILNKNK